MLLLCCRMHFSNFFCALQNSVHVCPPSRSIPKLPQAECILCTPRVLKYPGYTLNLLSFTGCTVTRLSPLYSLSLYHQGQSLIKKGSTITSEKRKDQEQLLVLFLITERKVVLFTKTRKIRSTKTGN